LWLVAVAVVLDILAVGALGVFKLIQLLYR
jgi:hypothetical protein